MGGGRGGRCWIRSLQNQARKSVRVRHQGIMVIGIELKAIALLGWATIKTDSR
jgi:hypothetical protein